MSENDKLTEAFAMFAESVDLEDWQLIKCECCNKWGIYPPPDNDDESVTSEFSIRPSKIDRGGKKVDGFQLIMTGDESDDPVLSEDETVWDSAIEAVYFIIRGRAQYILEDVEKTGDVSLN